MQPLNEYEIQYKIKLIEKETSNIRDRINKIASLLNENPNIQIDATQATKLIGLVNSLPTPTEVDKKAIALFGIRASKEAEALLSSGKIMPGGVIGGKQESSSLIPPHTGGSFQELSTENPRNTSTVTKSIVYDPLETGEKSSTESPPSSPLTVRSSSPSSTSSVTSDSPGSKPLSLKKKLQALFSRSTKDSSLEALEKKLKKSKNLDAWMKEYSDFIKTAPEQVSIDTIKNWIAANSGKKPFFGLASVPLPVQLAMIKSCKREDIVKEFPEMVKNYNSQISNANSNTPGAIITGLRQDFGRDLSGIDISYNNKPLAVTELAQNIRPVKDQIESCQASIKTIKSISSIEYPDFLAALEENKDLSPEQKNPIKDSLRLLRSNTKVNPKEVRNNLENLRQLTSNLRSSMLESWESDQKLKDETNTMLLNIKTKLTSINRLEPDKSIEELQAETIDLYDQLEKTLSRRPEAMTFREQLLTGEEAFIKSSDLKEPDKEKQLLKLTARKNILENSRFTQETMLKESGLTFPGERQTGFYHHTEVAKELITENDKAKNNKMLQAIRLTSSAIGLSTLGRDYLATKSKTSDVIIEVMDQEDNLIVKTNYTFDVIEETGNNSTIRNEVAFDLNKELCAMSLSYS